MITHTPPRLQWVYACRPVYFLTACTERRRPLLASPDMHRAFMHFCDLARGRQVSVGRYVLMPDHLHCFAALGPEAPSLSAWMKSLKNVLSKTLRLAGFPAPHWQRGFFDHLLRSAESYSQKWDYVRENPVRACLVTRSEDWPYQGEHTVLDPL